MVSWTIAKKGEGYVVAINGKDWGMEPRSKAEAEAYMERAQARWPGSTALFLIGEGASDKPPPAFRQGGPWIFVYPDGEVNEVDSSRKADAMGRERLRLGRQRLPKGTVVMHKEDYDEGGE